MERDFTVVVPVHNLKNSLPVVLRCLEAQSYPLELFECVIVDDGSTDGTREFLESYQSPLQLVPLYNATCKGRGVARNVGWRNGTSKVIVFLDGDTLPAPTLLDDYGRAFARGDRDVVSGTRYCIDCDPTGERLEGSLAALAETTPNLLFRKEAEYQFGMIRRHAALGPYRSPVFEQFETQIRELCLQDARTMLGAYAFAAANVAVRRHWLEITKGFDQFLRRGEDTDLGIRLWEAGARFGFADGAESYHMSLSSEANRSLDPGERITFFYRNPYRLVLLVYLWFIHRLDKNPGLVPRALESLRGLAEELSGDSAFDIDEQFQLLGHPRIPMECCHTKESIISYYVEMLNIPRCLISAWLDRGVADGLFTTRKDGERLFDFCLTSNWLRYRAPLHEYLMENASYLWKHRWPLMMDRRASIPQTVKCRGRYQITMSAEGSVKRKVAAVLNIPLPIQNASQSNVIFTGCHPSNLLAYADRDQTMIRRYPWSDDDSELRVTYDFECEIREVCSPSNEAGSPDPKVWCRYSRPSLTPRDYPKAKAILKKTGMDNRCKPFEVATKLYSWILDNMSVYEAPIGYSNILDTGFGACIDLARLFVNLCRLASVPARECCGALFTSRLGTEGAEHIEMRTLCFSPFMHTWAEFWILGQGWIPVDFCTWGYGKRYMTARNVTHPKLREEILSDTKISDQYYFGHVDPYRIHASPEVNTSQVSFERPDGNHVPNWKARTSMKHCLSITILADY